MKLVNRKGNKLTKKSVEKKTVKESKVTPSAVRKKDLLDSVGHLSELNKLQGTIIAHLKNKIGKLP